MILILPQPENLSKIIVTPHDAQQECVVEGADKVGQPKGVKGSPRAKAAAIKQLEKRFTKYTVLNRYEQLRRGFIGAVLNQDGRIVVIVDPDKVDEKATEAEVENAVADERRRNPQTEQLDVNVQSGCFSSEQLIEAQEVLEDRSFYPETRAAGYGWYLDPADSRYHVFFNSKDREAAQALEEELGDRVAITLDDSMAPASGAGPNRAGDASPHFGGASVRVQGTAEASACTSSFKIRYTAANPAGNVNEVGAMGAGHCYDDGNIVFSGGQYYGRVYEDSVVAPISDGVFIDDVRPVTFDRPHQTFADDIYTNSRVDLNVLPRAQNPAPMEAIESRDVEGQYDIGPVEPAASDFCVSGRISGNVCDAGVFLPTFAFCFAGSMADEGCVFNMVVLSQKQGEQLVTPGDSGGPAYACVDNQNDTTPNPTSSKRCPAGNAVKIIGLVSFLGPSNGIGPPDGEDPADGTLRASNVSVSRVSDLRLLLPFAVADDSP